MGELMRRELERTLKAEYAVHFVGITIEALDSIADFAKEAYMNCLEPDVTILTVKGNISEETIKELKDMEPGRMIAVDDIKQEVPIEKVLEDAGITKDAEVTMKPKRIDEVEEQHHAGSIADLRRKS